MKGTVNITHNRICNHIIVHVDHYRPAIRTNAMAAFNELPENIAVIRCNLMKTLVLQAVGVD